MQYINRDAMILYPRQALYDWANDIFEEDMDYGKINPYEHDTGTIFLIEELDSPEDFDSWINSNYKYFFAEMLEHWTPANELWPETISYTMFQEWFHVVYHSMIADSKEVPLLRDED